MIKCIHNTAFGVIREDEDGNTYSLEQLSAKVVVWKLIEIVVKTDNNGNGDNIVSMNKALKT